MRWAVVALALLACAEPWQTCARKGGRYYTGRDGRGACLMPAADAGKPCRDRKECQVLCLCPGNLSFPGACGHPELDQYENAEMTGQCAEYPPASGGGWQCTIDAGRVHRHGIIVD